MSLNGKTLGKFLQKHLGTEAVYILWKPHGTTDKHTHTDTHKKIGHKQCPTVLPLKGRVLAEHWSGNTILITCLGPERSTQNLYFSRYRPNNTCNFLAYAECALAVDMSTITALSWQIVLSRWQQQMPTVKTACKANCAFVIEHGDRIVVLCQLEN